MIRKWTALFLSLVLAMMLPLTALADWQHTISVEPGDMLASEAALEDLLDVLALRFTKNDESGALTVLLNQKEIVTLGLTADQSGVYVESDLVGEDVLYISWEDGFAFLNKILASSVAETGLDEEALQELESGLSEMKNGIISTIEADNSSQSKFLPAKLEESMRAAEELFPNDPVMTEYVKGLYENIVFEEGKFADDWRDTADQKCRIAMDAADLTALCDTDYLKMMIKEAISAEATDATEEEINEATEMVIAEVRKLFEESGLQTEISGIGRE